MFIFPPSVAASQGGIPAPPAGIDYAWEAGRAARSESRAQDEGFAAMAETVDQALGLTQTLDEVGVILAGMEETRTAVEGALGVVGEALSDFLEEGLRSREEDEKGQARDSKQDTELKRLSDWLTGLQDRTWTDHQHVQALLTEVHRMGRQVDGLQQEIGLPT